MFWLAFKRGRTRCIMIVRAHSLIFARLMASMAMGDVKAEFIEGHELTRALMRKIPARMVGRLLCAEDAVKLLERISGR